MNLVNKNTSLLSKYGNKEDITFNNENDKNTLLLLEQPKENLDILRTIGLNHHVDEVQKAFNIKNSKKQIANIYNKPSFLGSDIKKLCNDYDLVISKTVNYKGAPFEGLPEIITNFISENSKKTTIPERKKTVKVYEYDELGDVKLDENGLKIFSYETVTIPEETVVKSNVNTGYSHWFIMAPRESFDGKTKNNCCTLFYRENDNSRYINEDDVFVEIASWGNSYSNIRKYHHIFKHIDYEKEFNLRNYPYDSGKNQNFAVIFYTFIIFTIISLILGMYCKTVPMIVIPVITLLSFLIFRKKGKSYESLWKIQR